MTGMDSFERYQRDEAWTWEHQALLRARGVAGNGDLCRRFEAARRRVITEAVHRDSLRGEVMEMRARMRHELSLAGPGRVRHQTGRRRHRRHRVPRPILGARACAPTPRARDLHRQHPPARGLAQFGVIDAATAAWLIDTYRGYRGVLHRLSLEGARRARRRGGAVPRARERISDLARCVRRGGLAERCASSRAQNVAHERAESSFMSANLIQPNAEHRYTVTTADLPCPARCRACRCGIPTRGCTSRSKRRDGSNVPTAVRSTRSRARPPRASPRLRVILVGFFLDQGRA